MRICYRNTSFKWLEDFLENQYIKNEKFISFSFDKESGGQDNFGNTKIIFDFMKLLEQNAIEIEYDTDFFKYYPNICMYITSYDSKEDYEEQNDSEEDLSWETIIEDYSQEEEIVIKKLIYKNGIILGVIFREIPNENTIKLCKEYNIPIKIIK